MQEMVKSHASNAIKKGRQLGNIAAVHKRADSICTLLNPSPWNLEWRRHAKK